MKPIYLASLLALTACGEPFTYAALDGPVEDVGAPPDARPFGDLADTGEKPDADDPPDASPTSEASAPSPDAGDPPDSATERDARPEVDASAPPDASEPAPDASSATDSASAPDTAEPPLSALCCNTDGQAPFTCVQDVQWYCILGSGSNCYNQPDGVCPLGTLCGYNSPMTGLTVQGHVGLCR
jgi:hypothetical protein